MGDMDALTSALARYDCSPDDSEIDVEHIVADLISNICSVDGLKTPRDLFDFFVITRYFDVYMSGVESELENYPDIAWCDSILNMDVMQKYKEAYDSLGIQYVYKIHASKSLLCTFYLCMCELGKFISHISNNFVWSHSSRMMTQTAHFLDDKGVWSKNQMRFFESNYDVVVIGGRSLRYHGYNTDKADMRVATKYPELDGIVLDDVMLDYYTFNDNDCCTKHDPINSIWIPSPERAVVEAIAFNRNSDTSTYLKDILDEYLSRNDSIDKLFVIAKHFDVSEKMVQYWIDEVMKDGAIKMPDLSKIYPSI